MRTRPTASHRFGIGPRRRTLKSHVFRPTERLSPTCPIPRWRSISMPASSVACVCGLAATFRLTMSSAWLFAAWKRSQFSISTIPWVTQHVWPAANACRPALRAHSCRNPSSIPSRNVDPERSIARFSPFVHIAVSVARLVIKSRTKRLPSYRDETVTQTKTGCA